MGVNITEGNGNIGTASPSADGIGGIVLTGASEGSIVAGTPFLVTSMLDVTTAGMTTTNNAFAYGQLQQLFNELNLQGITSCQLYVMLITSATKINSIFDHTNANGVIKLLNFAGGKVRLLAGATNDTAVYPGGTGLIQTAGINADVYTAITNAQALAVQFFNAQTPVRCLIGGTSFNGTASQLTDQTQSTNNRVACLIGDTASGNSAAVGLALGRLMAIPVQRKMSRVKNGPLSSATAYISTTSADQYTQQSVIASKGFITIQTIIGKSGFYFSGDPTCTATTDDYAFICRGRIIDKAQTLSYAYFVDDVDDEVPVNTDGTIDGGYAKTLEQGIVNTLALNMGAQNNIDGTPVAFVDPTQNVLANSTVNVVLTITPPGYASTINVTLGF